MYLNTDDKIIYIYLKSEFSSPKAPIGTYTKCSALFHLTLPYFFSTKSEKLKIMYFLSKKLTSSLFVPSPCAPVLPNIRLFNLSVDHWSTCN